MEQTFIIENLKELISDIKKDEGLKNKLSSNMSLIDDIGLDSLQMITFMLDIENRFQIELDFEKIDLKDLKSIEKLAKFISIQKKIC